MDSLTTGLFFQTLPENGLEGYCRGLNNALLLSYYHENQNVFGDFRSFSRSMDLFTIDMEGCRDQCDRDENCVGFSTTQESFEFPSRCLIHTENLETMPAFGWRAIVGSDQLESSSAIISHSGDRGVHCYSKISKQLGPEISRDESSDNLKCGPSSSDSRVFDLRSEEATLEGCTNACLQDPSCVAFSGVFDSWCVGCSVPLDENHNGAVAYKTIESNDELDEGFIYNSITIADPNDFESAIAEINWCSAGIRSGQHCCLKSCGLCGGWRCGRRNGGGKGCCHGAIQESKQICRNSKSVACMIPKRTEDYIVDFQRASNRHVCSGYNSEGSHMSLKQCQDLCNAQQGCVGIFGAFNTNNPNSVSGNGACYSCHTVDYGEIGWANILLWKPRERAGSFSFDLRGRDGSERVRIDDGVSVRELVLSKEWTAFTTVSRYLQISFENDDGSRDVRFRSNFDAEIQHPERWVDWNCGFLNDLTEEENSRCQTVRSGWFAWRGDYQVEFIDRN